ncbi:CGNR zinc finger domain-containing protein [Actinacidiphila yanglinensis]|uniref:CGNR zinc finger domain-containing protein n=1 Tax=Actinacidiphila yanglinensis TaxID=310779 RepID=UPI0013578E82|nr:CGNR zinc finger domain-containing protein [Actinacidiphila yanglinensis]
MQELLNTAAPKARSNSPDLLATPERADAWMHGRGIPAGTVDTAALRSLRDALRAALVHREEGGPAPSAGDGLLEAPIAFRLSPDGSVHTPGASSGVTAVLERVLLAVHDAQLTGAWARLKVCRSPECRVAFWDQSRNTNAVWHDSQTCGNIANLRASRARRKAGEQDNTP